MSILLAHALVIVVYKQITDTNNQYIYLFEFRYSNIYDLFRTWTRECSGISGSGVIYKPLFRVMRTFEFRAGHSIDHETQKALAGMMTRRHG